MSDPFLKRLQQHLRLAILLHLESRSELHDRRLSILRILSQAPAYTANASIIQDFLSDMGHETSRDKIRTDIAWLDEQGLVRRNVYQDVHGAQAGSRGLEVADGKIIIPGISAPASLDGIRASLLKISLSPSDDEFENEIMWLVGRNLIEICVFGSVYMITDKGRAIAQGRLSIDGIKRPSGDTLMRVAAQGIKGSFSD